jgi:DNA-binding transcriptional LysR family regulator
MIPSDDDIELRRLRYFVAVAQERHFGRAAARVGIQQPPLTQQIQRLEQQLGVTLLTRRPRVTVTPAGQVLLAHALRLLAQAERAVDATRRVSQGLAGTLDVGFAASTLTVGLAQAIYKFRHQTPGVQLRLHELSSADQVAALQSGVIDIGLVREAVPHVGIRCDVIFSEKLVAVLPPGHALAKRRAIPLASLAGESFVHFPRHVAPGLYDRIAKLCHSAGFMPTVTQEAHEWLTLLSLVDAAIGVTLAPASFKRLKWGDVRYVRLTSPADRETSVAVCRRADDQSEAAAHFADVLRDIAHRQRRQSASP